MKSWWALYEGPRGRTLVGSFNSEAEAKALEHESNDVTLGGGKFVGVEAKEWESNEVQEENRLRLLLTTVPFDRWVTFHDQNSELAEMYIRIAKRNGWEVWCDDSHFDNFLAVSNPGKYEPNQTAKRIL